MQRRIRGVLFGRLAILLLILSACNNEKQYGDITIYTHYISVDHASNLKPQSLPSSADKVIVTITGTDFNPIVKEFSTATNPSGATIDNIPAGSERSVGLEVLDTSSNIIARGKATGVKINAGSINRVDILITQTGVFTNLDSKVIPRAFATSIPMSNGRYMIIGGIVNLQSSCGNGCIQFKATTQTEFYEPQTGTFQSGPMMIEPKVFFTANLLEDGSVVITGGTDVINISCTLTSCSISVPQDHAEASIEIYDPVSNSFYKASALSIPRVGHTANVVMKNNLLVTGGISSNGITNNVELIDLSTWKETTFNMTSQRAFHNAIAFSDEEVILAGGSTDNNKVEFFKPSSFTLSNSITCSTFFPSSIFIPVSNKIIFNGGLNQYFQPTQGLIFIDPLNKVVLSYHNMWLARALFHNIMLGDGNILIAGGVTTATFTTTNVAEIFNPVSRSFVRFPQLITARAGYAGQYLPDGTALIVSGFSNINPLNGTINFVDTAEIYNP